jgi:hypothetical protein
VKPAGSCHEADAIVHNQLMMAQGIDMLAHHIEQSTGYLLTPVVA